MQYSNFLKRVFMLVFFFGIGAFLSAVPTAAETDTLPVERYALYVSSNDGGAKRETLKYAGTEYEGIEITVRANVWEAPTFTA